MIHFIKKYIFNTKPIANNGFLSAKISPQTPLRNLANSHENTIIIGDLHANPITLVRILMEKCIFKLNQTLYSNLCSNYYQYHNDLLSGSYNDEMMREKHHEIIKLLNQIELEPEKKKIILLGDEHADRGASDAFIDQVLSKIENYEILLSNHSLVALFDYNNIMPQFVLSYLADKKLSLNSDRSWIQKVKIFSYLETEEFLILSHGPAGNLQNLSRLAKLLGLEETIDLYNRESIKLVINSINLLWQENLHSYLDYIQNLSPEEPNPLQKIYPNLKTWIKDNSLIHDHYHYLNFLTNLIWLRYEEALDDFSSEEYAAAKIKLVYGHDTHPWRGDYHISLDNTYGKGPDPSDEAILSILAFDA